MSSPNKKGSPKKRGRILDFDSIAKIANEDGGAKVTVHGVVSQLSPVKTGAAKKYYSGTLSDEDKSIRFVSFCSRQLETQTFKEKSDPIVFSNCELKQNNFTGRPQLELHVHPTSLLEKSAKSFADVAKPEEWSVSNDETKPPKTITLSQLHLLDDYTQPLNVKVKATRIEPARTASNGSLVQTVTVADSTGCTEVDLWSEFIGDMKMNQCYELTGFRKKSFNDENTLFTPRKNAAINPIQEAIRCNESSEETDFECIVDASVETVVTFISERRCPACKKGSVLPIPEQPAAGKCGGCKSVTRMLACSNVTSAELLLQCDDKVSQSYKAYDNILADIQQTEIKDVSMTGLVMSSPFNAYVKRGAIRKVERPSSHQEAD